MILEFDDLDMLAETLWALIVRTHLQSTGLSDRANEFVSHEQWLALPDSGKQAARGIASDIAKIFEVKQ